ncbi:hypothetical protein BHE74_00033793 [Ensete ventricosum]|nr:hypothetical protein BHE74_00033793 [Ensete ventricosum]
MYQSVSRPVGGPPATGRYRRLGLFPPRYHSKLTGNGRFRPLVADFERYQSKEGEEKPGVRCCSSLALSVGYWRFLLPAWGEGTRRRPLSDSCNPSEKTKSKVARGGEFSSLTKTAQQSHVNHTVRPPARSDIQKTSQVGNFQVLNREKNGVFPAAKDSPSVGKGMNPIGIVPSSAILPLKSLTDQKLKADKNGALTHTSTGERKLLSQAQNRNDFFNLLRKKSLTSSSAIPEPSSVETVSILGRSEAENPQITSSVNMENNNLKPVSESDQPTEISDCLDGDSCASDGSARFYTGNGETNPCSDVVVDPEEEAFLQSLGWDKNAWEEALTKEEIDAFLKKVGKKFFFPMPRIFLVCTQACSHFSLICGFTSYQ